MNMPRRLIKALPSSAPQSNGIFENASSKEAKLKTTISTTQIAMGERLRLSRKGFGAKFLPPFIETEHRQHRTGVPST
jgi:hypothetical protein